MENKETNELPMAWYKFTQYVRIPLGVLSDSLFIINNFYYVNPLITIIGIVWIVFSIYLVYAMSNKLKCTFKYIMIHSAISTFALAASSNSVGATVQASILVCNYIYFKKRQYLFIN